MNRHSLNMEKRREFINKHKSLPEDLFDFYKKLFDAQESAYEKLPDNMTDFLPVNTDFPPYLIKEKIKLSDEIVGQLEVLLGDIIEIVSRVNPGMDFSSLKEAFNEFAGEAVVKLLLHDFQYFENKAAELRLDLPELLFMIHNVFKPFLVKGREEAPSVPDKEDWLKGNCPYCGYMPGFSKIVESGENKRVLHCSLCECEWAFPRMQCHICGNTDHDTLGFFEYEDAPDYRAYYCDKCRNYIKSVRIPKMREEAGYDLTVEDIITGFIDSTMIGKEYNRN